MPPAGFEPAIPTREGPQTAQLPGYGKSVIIYQYTRRHIPTTVKVSITYVHMQEYLLMLMCQARTTELPTISCTSALRNCPSSPVFTVTESPRPVGVMGRRPEFPGCHLHSSFAPVTWIHTAGSFFFTRVVASLGIRVFGRFSSAWIAVLPRSTTFSHSLILPSHTAAQRVYKISVFMARYFITV
jgi:hypothetical protein